MIKKGFLISIFSMFILTQSVFGKSIMEEYFQQGNYTYIINQITDVVYIRYEEGMGYWQEINYLIPMYKADGSLMTGEEFKKIMEEGNFQEDKFW